MLVSTLSRLAALRRAHDKPLLHEIGLVHVFDGVGIFRERRRKRGEAHRTPAELHGKQLQNTIVDRVEAQVIHLEEAERLRRNVLVDNTVAPHLCPVAHALEHAVRQTRSSTATAGDLERAVLADGNIKDGSRAHNNRCKFLGRVILQAECNAEAVAQRTCEQARSRRRTDEREVGQIEANRSRGRPLPHHDIEREILERGIEHFLDHTVQAMNLVDEENVALFEVRENRSQVARSLNSRPARRADVRTELVGDHRSKRGLAKPRRAGEQDVVGALFALLRRLDEDSERFFHLGLSQVVAQFLRAQAAVKREVVLLQVGRHRTIACRRGRSPLHRSCRLEDHSLYLNTVRHCALFI